jgi:hypothetical protein
MPTLEPFDPSRQLVAATFIRLHAVIYRKGDQVPYDPADDRVLKRLYEQRKIAYGEGQPVEARSPRQQFHAANTERRQQERAATVKPEPIETVEEATADQLAAADKMAKAHNHDKLFQAASGLAGVTKAMKKAEIALALVRAGREPS